VVALAVRYSLDAAALRRIVGELNRPAARAAGDAILWRKGYDMNRARNRRSVFAGHWSPPPRYMAVAATRRATNHAGSLYRNSVFVACGHAEAQNGADMVAPVARAAGGRFHGS
jgi:hypothetical protein